MIVDVHVAQADLPRLIERACAGEEVVICVDSRPAVKLEPVDRPLGKRVFGSMRGKISVSNEFFEPLPEDEISAWGQG